MADYRCYILDAEDHILQAYEIECEDDARARSAAEDLLARDPYHRSVEVWERTRRILKLERDASFSQRHMKRAQRASRPMGAAAQVAGSPSC